MGTYSWDQPKQPGGHLHLNRKGMGGIADLKVGDSVLLKVNAIVNGLNKDTFNELSASFDIESAEVIPTKVVEDQKLEVQDGLLSI